MSEQEDPVLTVRLPMSAWQVVLSHLELGLFRLVAPVLGSVIEQVEPQIAAAVAASRAKVVEEARNVAEAADAAQLPRAEPAHSPNAKAIH